MGLKEFKILFDNPGATYYPGQTVSGNVFLLLDSLKKVRSISVTIKGEANTCWSSDKRELDDRGQYQDESQTVTGHEEYLMTKYCLIGSASGPEIEIQLGEHKFPFTCALPPILPSSFECDFGHVRYTVKATLDHPWKFDQEVKALFTVISPFDLNVEPRASEPIDQEMSKTFCCLYCGTPPLTVHYSLPVRGYVPGQSMPVKIIVENHSGVTVDTVKLVLYKNVILRATTPRTDTRNDEVIVTEVSKGPVGGGATIDYEQTLEIPPLPPSNLSNCGIIDVEYNLKVEACVSGWYHRNLKNNVVVFVGTIPVIKYETPSAPPASAMENYPNKIDSSPSSPVRNFYPELLPPSYEESVYGARNLRERGESQFLCGLIKFTITWKVLQKYCNSCRLKFLEVRRAYLKHC